MLCWQHSCAIDRSTILGVEHRRFEKDPLGYFLYLKGLLAFLIATDVPFGRFAVLILLSRVRRHCPHLAHSFGKFSLGCLSGVVVVARVLVLHRVADGLNALVVSACAVLRRLFGRKLLQCDFKIEFAESFVV